MSRRRLVRELQAVRVLVRDGLDRLDAEAGDAEQFWVASARHRLVSLDDVLVSAAGGLSAWSRTLISSAVAFPLLWAVATGVRALGTGSGWVIVTTVAALAVAMPALLATTAGISRAVNRRRMSRPHADTGRIPRQRDPEARPPAHDGAANGGRRSASPAWGGSAPDGKGDRTEPIVDVLLRARVRLVSAALRQVPPKRWRVGRLARLAADDRSVGRIADADLLLCQAIDFIEIYGADRKPGWVR